MVAVATEKQNIKILIQSTLGIINLKVQTFLCPIMYNILASSDKINKNKHFSDFWETQ